MSIERSLLLVDDDREFVDTLTRRFLQLGFQVTALYHPRQAMQAASFNQFEVAVIDQGLPETAGIDLMEQLFREQTELRTIIMSGFADSALKREAEQRGAFAYLLKPCKLAELVSVVDQALAAAPLLASVHRPVASMGEHPHATSRSSPRDAEQPIYSTVLERIDEYAG